MSVAQFEAYLRICVRKEVLTTSHPGLGAFIGSRRSFFGIIF